MCSSTAENDTEYTLTADVPGMSKEHVKVEIDGDTLLISGEQAAESSEHGGASRHGSFYHRKLLSRFDAPHARA